MFRYTSCKSRAGFGNRGTVTVAGSETSPVSTHMIPRSAKRRLADGRTESRLLSDWADLGAFVLLAEPGGGKSEAFRLEALDAACSYVKARDFANGVLTTVAAGQRADSEGFVPRTPSEMQDRLIGSIPRADRTRLTVRVLDLSLLAKPIKRKRRAVKSRAWR